MLYFLFPYTHPGGTRVSSFPGRAPNWYSMQTPRISRIDTSYALGVQPNRMVDRWFGPVIYLTCMLTISTPSVTIGGIPRLTIAALIATVYFLLKTRGKIHRSYLQFAIAYIVAFIPGSFVAAASGELNLMSCLQLAASLMAFIALGSYFTAWLSDTPSNEKIKTLKGIIIFSIIFSILEILFYNQLYTVRTALYWNEFTQHYGQIFLRRDLALYGGRPTGFFSETSNFARFLGLIITALLALSRGSMKALLALVVAVVLLRSVSVLFAAPAIAIILFKIYYLENRKSSRLLKLIGVLFAACIVFLSILGTQTDRIESATTLTDGSFNSRIAYPAMYIIENLDDLFWGKGATPQYAVQAYTQAKQFEHQNIVQVEGFNEGISNFFVIISGIGFIGGGVFFLFLFSFFRWRGIIYGLSFLLSNVIASGYNSPSLFIPAALLQGILMITLNSSLDAPRFPPKTGGSCEMSR